MTAIPTTATVAAASATCELPRKTYLDHRAQTSPGWVLGIVGLVSPGIGLCVYAFKQRSWAYMNINLTLFVTLFTVALASPEGEINKGAKYALQMSAGGAAALVAANNKKKARKELGIND